MASQPGYFNLQEFTDAGLLLVGGRLYTYDYGTTTLKTAYTDAAGAVAHTYTSDGAGGQYIALNSRGELPAPLYLASGSYDITLKRADGSTVWTRRTDGTDPNIQIGQCRLAKSGANLVLSPYQGNRLSIGGVVQTVPSAGVSLAPTALSVGTTYYIYAAMSGSTMTLEASTTTHATDTTTGVEVKSGDSTRSLVGMARIITGPAWQDSLAQRFVVSWFNQRLIAGSAAFTASRTTVSTTAVEINSEIRNEFLTWATTAVQMNADGQVQNNTANQTTSSTISVDGSSIQDTLSTFQAYGVNAVGTLGCAASNSALSEGYHYATILGFVGAGSTGTWFGSGSAASRVSLKTIISG